MASLSIHPRVLIVDDDVDSADALALLFRMNGFDSAVARGGRAALQAAGDQQPDVIVTDIRMPSIDGHALAKWVRMENAPLDRPFLVAYSGVDRNDERYVGYLDAFDLWFTKPSYLAVMLEAVRDLIDQRASGPAAARHMQASTTRES